MGTITPTTKRTPSTPLVHPDSYPTDITQPNVNREDRTLSALSVNIELSRSVPRSGRGGRRFKSCHSDQLFSHEKPSRGTIWGTKRADCAADMLGRECREAPPQNATLNFWTILGAIHMRRRE